MGLGATTGYNAAMSPGDRTFGSSPGGSPLFAPTQWSVVLAAGRGSRGGVRSALAALCQTYWHPLYYYIRRRGYRAEEAQDLTQEFFARLLEKDYLQAADPQRGRFRSFLAASVNHFLANEWDHARARKRGGGRKPIPLDGDDAEARYSLEPAHTLTAERLFERQWALTLLDVVLAELRQQAGREGKQVVFERLREFLGGPGPGASYGQAAADLGMTEAAVKTAVYRLRRRYRRLLRDRIAQTVASADDIDDEIRHLFAALDVG
jgi:RNA polymerase sigma-70 factor (ECF subfamily)